MAAVAGDARAARRRAGPVRLLPPPPDGRAPSSIGLYSIVATLFWGRIFFGVPLDFVHPLQLAVALAGDGASASGMLGLVLASTFVLARQRQRVLEPARVSGLARHGTARAAVAPARPGSAPISWVLAPTWGIEAIRDAALGGSSAWPEIGMCAALGVVYLALGTIFLPNFERLARQRATLALT